MQVEQSGAFCITYIYTAQSWPKLTLKRHSALQLQDLKKKLPDQNELEISLFLMTSATEAE